MDLNENELENLKNRYKTSPNKPTRPEKSETSDVKNRFLRLFEKGSNSLKYIVVLLSYVIVLFLIVYIADQWVIPSLVHDRQTVVVPDIEGKSLSDASDLLNTNSLYYEVVSEQYSGESKGTVLRQIPKPNVEVKSNRPIFITISRGREVVKMPDLIGTSIRSAKVKLYDIGLNVGEVNYRYSDEFPNDSIISQSVSDGIELVYGDTVNLTVSKGSEFQIYIPKLVGLALDGIETYIVSQKFNLGNVEFVESSTFVSGTIISQTPEANTLAMPGEYINIVVAK